MPERSPSLPSEDGTGSGSGAGTVRRVCHAAMITAAAEARASHDRPRGSQLVVGSPPDADRSATTTSSWSSVNQATAASAGAGS
jgi:hypothetical protein